VNEAPAPKAAAGPTLSLVGRSLSIALALVFSLAALAQWNDPDPFAWMALYGLAAGVGLLSAFGRSRGWLEAAAFLCFAAAVLWLAPAVADFRIEAVNSLEMHTPSDEEVRELGGALLGLFFLGALLALRARRAGVSAFAVAAAAAAAFLFVVAAFVVSTPDHRPSKPAASKESDLSGAQVAERYCQSCHRLPAPDQLPKEAWPFVLEWMGNYVGYRRLEGPYAHITGSHLIPDKPLVSLEEMDRLGKYLIGAAPFQKDFRIQRPPNPPLAGYTPRVLEGGGPVGGVVSLVHVDEERGLLFVGLAQKKELRIFDRAGTRLHQVKFNADPVHVEPRPEGFRLTLAGDFNFDQQRSEVIDFEFVGEELRATPLIQGFHRATQSWTRDIDGDGREDLVLVGFGDGVGPGYGKVSLFWGAASEGTEPAGFEEQVLLDRAGGLGAQVDDVDGDGLLDVVILTTQGRSELVAYLQRAGRRFETKVLLEEHVSIGYNEFKLVDFDGDGRRDVLLVNGNNMEMLDPPLRPYHGVRILRNVEALRYEEVYRYAMYGAMTATADDLDGDGDLGILVNAFYPDWVASEPETLTLLRNQGDYRFEASSLGGEHWGRWLRATTGDLDGDGRKDILLGAGNLPGGGLHPGRPRLYQRYGDRLQKAPAVLRLYASETD